MKELDDDYEYISNRVHIGGFYEYHIYTRIWRILQEWGDMDLDCGVFL